jgi:hypothetical protein
MIEILSRVIKQQKEIKGIQLGKEEVKVHLFEDDIILFFKDPEDSSISPLNLIKINNIT